MALTREQAEDFLYRETRFLDEGRLEEWLQLFTEDGIYWLPLTAGHDPQQEPSIIYDDQSRRERRVYQLIKEPRLAQRPPSRTVHMISNVEVEEEEGQGNSRMASSRNPTPGMWSGIRSSGSAKYARAFSTRADSALGKRH